jgi:hypothetical protein
LSVLNFGIIENQGKESIREENQENKSKMVYASREERERGVYVPFCM